MSRFTASTRLPPGKAGTRHVPDSATRLIGEKLLTPGGIYVKQKKPAVALHANVLLLSIHSHRRHLAGSHRSPLPDSVPSWTKHHPCPL